jgi:hypothetical protein
VIIGAVLWLPISFGVATLMHAVLVAKAASLPPWMQLLHPVATVTAKSMLLVLPAYPAAWPQAKRHPIVQAMITFWRHLTTLDLMRKIGHRYRRTESAIAVAAQVSGFAAPAIGARHLLGPPLAACNATAAAIGRGLRALSAGTVAVLSALPLSSGIVRRYKEHCEEVSRQPSGIKQVFWDLSLERGAPFTTAGFARMLERAGAVAKLLFRRTRTCSGTPAALRLPTEPRR